MTTTNLSNKRNPLHSLFGQMSIEASHGYSSVLILPIMEQYEKASKIVAEVVSVKDLTSSNWEEKPANVQQAMSYFTSFIESLSLFSTKKIQDSMSKLDTPTIQIMADVK